MKLPPLYTYLLAFKQALLRTKKVWRVTKVPRYKIEGRRVPKVARYKRLLLRTKKV